MLDNDDDDADSDIDSSSSCVVSFADETAAEDGGAESINCARRRRAANNPCKTLSLLLVLDDVLLCMLAVAWKAARCLAVVELILNIYDALDRGS